eukprot:363236-Lingulodinium_polyedra.AAC.1
MVQTIERRGRRVIWRPRGVPGSPCKSSGVMLACEVRAEGRGAGWSVVVPGNVPLEDIKYRGVPFKGEARPVPLVGGLGSDPGQEPAKAGRPLLGLCRAPSALLVSAGERRVLGAVMAPAIAWKS